MRQDQVGVLGLALVVIMAMVSLYPREADADSCEQWVAKVTSAQGSVQIRKAGDTRWQPVRLNDTLCPGDMIRVQELSRADIFLSNESTLRLDQKTTVTFPAAEKEGTSFIDLLRGAVHFFSRFPRGLKVATPFVNGTIKGTEFLVKVDEEQTFLSIFEGEVVASNDAGSVILGKGQSAMARKGQAPVVQVIVRPRDAVQWALYYPPVIYNRAADLPPGGQKDWQMMVQKSIQSYQRGDLEAAFANIAEVPEDLRDARFFTYRASLLLSVGRVDEARRDIGKALGLAPADSNAIALQSVIAVAQNDKANAFDLAQKAVNADPRSASARIALSYALQANFDLRGAMDSLKEAVKLDPENALAWARLAELYSSLGYLDESRKAAEKAVALNPNLSRTQTVLGFAHLTQINTKASKAAFTSAIELDQADALPRLGLGLAMIREGDLEPGRREIEIAASLDPGNSLIRSYLGKAFYEEKRDKLAVDQFIIAEELDLSDPTPWFYEAIQKQSVNRPVEALHDMEKAISLNDNRAVYRSRLLLDADLAARSASLARIYSDLGFQQLALVEGWKSVNTDPADFSGHRLLADTYSALPRHEIARVSELLQSQLLQPININPVQPSLAEANLFILNGAGPTDPSFLEFNPLFNRNRLALQLSGITGSNSTLGDEVVVSGVYQKLSFSIGQFHYETNGFRENNDQMQNIYNAFVQVSLSPETSVQAEFRAKDTKNGDLELRFNPDDFQSGLRQESEVRSARFGFHHSFQPGSDLIGSFIYEKTKSQGILTDSTPDLTLTFNDKIDGNTYSAELQHLLRSERFSVIAGAGYLKSDREETQTTDFTFAAPEEPISQEEVLKGDIRHANVYLYSRILYPKNIVWTLGASADFFKDTREEFRDRNRVNPKFGVTWTPLAGTTFRAAYFQVLARTLTSTRQTLEPTQVAGFNQFFDDPGGTQSQRYGFAIDQRFSAQLHGGLEYSWRKLKVPTEVTNPPAPPEFLETERKERLGRAYLYWTPHPWVALTAEYNYERQDRGTTQNEGIELVKTHRVPLGAGFFHPSGWSLRARATYYDQSGKFQRLGSLDVPAEPGSDRFWIVDAALSYRLPKRLGIVSVEARNLFDETFRYQDTDPVNPVIQPTRTVFFKLTLAL